MIIYNYTGDQPDDLIEKCEKLERLEILELYVFPAYTFDLSKYFSLKQFKIKLRDAEDTYKRSLKVKAHHSLENLIISFHGAK